MHDLVVRGGRVVDGTGAPARTADVAVEDGLVVEVGHVPARGRREVDADGALVTPGFVDIHSHYDGQATWDATLVPSTWHGVTTVVMGNCGVGFAPCRPSDRNRLIELMEGVEDIPGTALHEGLPWTWETFEEYLDHLAARSYDADIAAQVPHGAVRLYVMGDRGGAGDAATDAEIAAMGAIARAGIAAGALGFTTSRTTNHKTSRGEPTPTLRAAGEELVGIATAMGGAGVLQVVSDFTDLDAEFSIMRSMVEASGCPLSISVAAEDHRAPWRSLRDRLAAAVADGLPMRGQVGARAIGVVLGFECTVHPFLLSPTFRDAGLAGGRDAIVREVESRGSVRLLTEWDRMFELTDPPDYEPPASASVGARAASLGLSPAALAFDLLAGGGMLYLPLHNWVDGCLDDVGEMLADPVLVPGLADGGAHVGTICDGSNTTTLLSWWGRDRPDGRLPLEWLVHRQSRATAETVGLLDRGALVPGLRADLNVIDHGALRLHAPFVSHDLPAGGRRLLQRADGYLHTFVAGVETYADGVATGALPGRLVRGAR
jgi:N-acyl-D-aspartate/D-glutamate deacylase